MGKWNSREYGPFIVNKVVVDGVVEIKDSGDEYTFTVKGKRIKIYFGS